MPKKEEHTMSEDLGTKLVGSTTYKKLFRSINGPEDIVPCTVPGGVAATFPMGAAMIDGDAAGQKKRYTNGGAVTGACILMRDVTTTVAGGNVTTDACRDGSVDTSMVVNMTGGPVDAGFKSALPKVMFD